MTTVHAVTATQKTVDGPSGKVFILQKENSYIKFRIGEVVVVLAKTSFLHQLVRPKLLAKLSPH
jgi:hypothetical protein